MHLSALSRFVGRKPAIAWLWVIAVATLSSAAHAEDPPAAAAPRPRPFGSKGQLVLDDLLAYRGGAPPGILGISHSRQVFGDSTSGWTVTSDSRSFDISADYFVMPRVSIGGRAGYNWTRSEVHLAGQTPESIETAARTLTFVPRVGFAVPLSDEVSLYPRFGIGYRQYDRQSGAGLGAFAGPMSTGWLGAVEAPFVFKPGRNFYFRAGPEVSFQWSPSMTSSSSAGDSATRGFRLGGAVAFGLLL